MRPSAFLEFREYRYLKLAAILVAAAVAVYGAAGGAAYGGTWAGYGLGILSAGLVLLLAWYGVRRRMTPMHAERRLDSRRRVLHAPQAGTDDRRVSERRKTRAEDHWRHGGTLQGWLSAHVYLGGALVVLVSLHAGFRFGWNVHSLAYALVLLVAGSGLYGTVAYMRFPRLITENSGGDTTDGMLSRLAELDGQARLRAAGLPGELQALVARSAQATVAAGAQRHGFGWPRACPTEEAVQWLQDAGKRLVHGDQPRQVRELHAVMLQKRHLLARLREEVRAASHMRLWLYAHVPLSVALLAALLAHVAAILIYW